MYVFSQTHCPHPLPATTAHTYCHSHHCLQPQPTTTKITNKNKPKIKSQTQTQTQTQKQTIKLIPTHHQPPLVHRKRPSNKYPSPPAHHKPYPSKTKSQTHHPKPNNKPTKICPNWNPRCEREIIIDWWIGDRLATKRQSGRCLRWRRIGDRSATKRERLTMTWQIGDEEAEIDDDEDRSVTKWQRSMTTRTDWRQRGRDQQWRAKMMNHGREKREVRERKERRKFKKKPLVNIKCFLFFIYFCYNPATMSCYW